MNMRGNEGEKAERVKKTRNKHAQKRNIYLLRMQLAAIFLVLFALANLRASGFVICHSQGEKCERGGNWIDSSNSSILLHLSI